MPRAELYDIAVNRAAGYAQRLGALTGQRDHLALHNVLELWYLKTRFAYRISLDEIIERLLQYPGPGHHWAGGPNGSWQPGDNPRP